MVAMKKTRTAIRPSRVLGGRDVEPETIEQGAEFLQGIVRKDDRLLILLDLQKTTEI